MPAPALPDILYEDTCLLAVNKPSGLLVHRGMARDGTTLIDLVRAYLCTEVAYPLHRIDRQTSGVVVFSKNGAVAKQLQAQLAGGGMAKRYIALVRGTPPDSGEIDHPVQRSEDGPKVPAKTVFCRLETRDTLPRTTSLVEAFPITGRFHQIRRHLKHLGHPVIGDANYGRGDINRAMAANYGLRRMALHARSLSFLHPETGEPLVICAPLSDDLLQPLISMGFSRLEYPPA